MVKHSKLFKIKFRIWVNNYILDDGTSSLQVFNIGQFA